MIEPKGKQAVEARAREVAEPLVAAEGLELIDIEYVRERDGWVLRLLIDKEGGGVGLDDCTKASHAVDTAFEVEDIIPHEYHLEVSSPGLNRPLTKWKHFEKAVGKRIKVKTYGPVGEPPRKNFTGVLQKVETDAVTVQVEGAGEFRLAMKDIARANLEFEF